MFHICDSVSSAGNHRLQPDAPVGAFAITGVGHFQDEMLHAFELRVERSGGMALLKRGGLPEHFAVAFEQIAVNDLIPTSSSVNQGHGLHTRD